MMRYAKQLRFILAAILLVSITVSPIVFAESTFVQDDLANAYLLAEKNGGRLLLEKNSEMEYPVAGLSRLSAMVLICEALDRGDLKEDDVVIVSEFAAAVPGSTAFLETGERISVESLLKCAVMISAGDAIMALAEKIHGTETAFLQVMNERLCELGIDANYESLSNTQVMLSAEELAVLGMTLADSESFTRYSGSYFDELVHENGRRTELANPNRLVKESIGCYGVATGSSSDAGYCGVFSFNRAGMDVICVVLGAQNSNDRFNAARELVEYGYANFRSVALATEGEIVYTGLPVNNGKLERVDLIAKKDLVLMVPNDISDPIMTEYIPQSWDAPFAEGDILGKIEYTDQSGHLLAVLELAAAKRSEAADYRDHLRTIFMKWLRNNSGE